MLTKEMQRALVADGEKLRQMTGEDHGPYLYEPPQQWFECDDCKGEGGHDRSWPMWDDPYFAVWVKCERCNGVGGWLDDGETIVPDLDEGE